MREIDVKGKQYSQTRYAIDCLAWATNRRGHNRWASDDVATSVYNYLVQNHVDMATVDFRGRPGVLVNSHHIQNAMERLVKAGLAKVKYTPGRYKRVAEFEFAADVILTGHDVNKRDPIDRLKESATRDAEISKGVGKIVTALTGPPPKLDIVLPMPEIPLKPYRHDEVTDLLSQWQKADADAHADYIDTLITTLKVLLGG